MRLVFSNAESTLKNIYVVCDKPSVARIMQWYGGYFAGDRYTVTYEGRNVPMDLNGEIREGHEL